MQLLLRGLYSVWKRNPKSAATSIRMFYLYLFAKFRASVTLYTICNTHVK